MDKHLVSIDDFDAIDRLELFSLVEILKGHQSDFRYRLKGKILTNLFYEPSTRTSSSFHAAMCKLGGEVIPIPNRSECVHS